MKSILREFFNGGLYPGEHTTQVRTPKYKANKKLYDQLEDELLEKLSDEYKEKLKELLDVNNSIEYDHAIEYYVSGFSTAAVAFAGAPHSSL